MAASALLVCLVCPFLEMFDTWDHTVPTGNDTEYTLVVVALCVGVAYSLARFVKGSGLVRCIAKSVIGFSAAALFAFQPFSLAFPPFDATSPPLLPLRI